MGHWVRWAAPSAIMISIAVPSHATQYLTLEQAQQLAFPDASRFVEAHVMFQPSDVAAIERRSGEKVRTRGQQVWRALAGDRPVGFRSEASRFVEAHVMFQPSDVAAIERRSGEKVRTRGQQVWRALAGDRPVGF